MARVVGLPTRLEARGGSDLRSGLSAIPSASAMSRMYAEDRQLGPAFRTISTSTLRTTGEIEVRSAIQNLDS